MFIEFSGNDIGWILSRAKDEVELLSETEMQFRVVGSDLTYQIITFDSASTGLYEDLEEAKRVAEKLFLLTRRRRKNNEEIPDE